MRPIIQQRDVIAQYEKTWQLLRQRGITVLVCRAQSGTGKTATFSIAALQTIDVQLRETQVLILSPTRELASQIQKVFYLLIDYMYFDDEIWWLGRAGAGRLHEHPMPLLHRRNEYRGGHKEVGLRSTYSVWNARTRFWYGEEKEK